MVVYRLSIWKITTKGAAGNISAAFFIEWGKKMERLSIDRIAFLGRTYAEYLKIFGLDESTLAKGPVLDCPAGASSFAAEAVESGFDVAACDVLYDLPVEELVRKGNSDILHVFDEFDRVSRLYTWSYYKDKEEVVGLRRHALERFASGFAEGREKGRYVSGALPNLPFPDKSFSLVLSGHLLFLYGDRLDQEFHRKSLLELARVGSEVRIFPLVGLDSKTYPYLHEMIAFLRSKGIEAEIIDVDFEFQSGATHILRLKKNAR